MNANNHGNRSMIIAFILIVFMLGLVCVLIGDKSAKKQYVPVIDIYTTQSIYYLDFTSNSITCEHTDTKVKFDNVWDMKEWIGDATARDVRLSYCIPPSAWILDPMSDPLADSVLIVMNEYIGMDTLGYAIMDHDGNMHFHELPKACK